MFSYGSKTICSRIMRRDLKELGLNNYVVTNKPFVSDINRKIDFNQPNNTKIGLLNSRGKSFALMSPNFTSFKTMEEL